VGDSSEGATSFFPLARGLRMAALPVSSPDSQQNSDRLKDFHYFGTWENFPWHYKHCLPKCCFSALFGGELDTLRRSYPQGMSK